MKTPEDYIKTITKWAKSQEKIQALALVGSYARKQARPDSDIDFLFMCQNTDILLNDISWINQFGKVEKSSREEWGIVTSLRVLYQDGKELEFGIAPLSWADLPADPGTRRVVSDGILILKDRGGFLANLHKSIPQKKAG